MSSAVIDTALGLGLTFFLVALISSAAVEAVANVVRKRAKYLLRGLRDMLDTPVDVEASKKKDDIAAEKELYAKSLTSNVPDGSAPPAPPGGAVPGHPLWTVQLMGHPLVRPFKQSNAAGGQTRNPSYLPARSFAAALVDMIVPNAQGTTTLDAIRASVNGLDPALPFKGVLLSLLNTAGQDVGVFMSALERWYDDQMARIGGSYKRWAKRWAIIIAILFAVLFQVDAVAIGTRLFVDAPLRESVAAAAVEAGQKPLCTPAQDESLSTTQACVTQAFGGLPVGWSAGDLQWNGGTVPGTEESWLLKALGWAITGFAASLGAPFWFDALGKLGSLRNTGQKPNPA